MGLTIRRMPSIKFRAISTVIAVFAFVVQPMYGLVADQIAHAAGSSLYANASQQIASNGSFVAGPINASSYTNLKLSFSYDAEALDNSDSFTYGWQKGDDTTTRQQIAKVEGHQETGMNQATDESGTVSSLGLPASTNVANLKLYFIDSGNAVDDVVNLTNISLVGDLTDTTSPTVSSVNVPANATYTTGQNLDFTVNYDEAVIVNTSGGAPRIALNIGGATDYASYMSGSGTSALTFRYMVQTGDNDNNGIIVGSTIALNGSQLKDVAANNANITLNNVGSTVGVLVDTTPTPTLTNGYFALDNTGFNVGFHAHDFKNVSAVTVDLQKADGTSIVKNIGEQDLFNLIDNQPDKEISTPFSVPVAATDSNYWDYGSRVWTSADEPYQAVVTISDDSGTTSIIVKPYTVNEATPGQVFASLLPVVDTISPTISFTNPTRFNDPTYNKYFAVGPNLAITASDASGIKNTSLHVYKADGTPEKYCPLTPGDTTTCDVSGLSQGDYYVIAAANDNASNPVYVTKHFTIDTTKPSVHISAPSDGSYSNTGDFTIEGTASDSLSDIDHVNVYVAHNPWNAGGYEVDSQLANFDSTTGTFTYDANNIPDGDYVIKAVAYDKAGNSRFANSVNLTVDKTAPVATIDGTDPSNKTFNGSTNIDVHVIDDNYSQTDIYRVGSTFHQTYHAPGTYFGLFWLKNGDYKMIVSDIAGNSTTYNFTIHRNDPAITFVNPARFNSGSYNQLFDNIGSIQIHATGDNRAIDNTVVHIYNADGSHSSAWCGAAVSGDTASCDASGLAEGDYYVKVAASDANGNATYLTKDFTIDNTAPAIPTNVTVKAVPSNATIGDNDYTETNKMQVSWSNGGTEPVDHYIYKTWTNIPNTPHNTEATAFTDSTLTTPTRTAYTNAGEGSYYIEIAACDAAGNCSQYTPAYTVNYDVSQPTAILDSQASILSGTVNITGSLTDNTSLDHYNLSLYPASVDLSDGGSHNADRIAVAGGWTTSGSTSVSGTNATIARLLDTTKLTDGAYQVRLGVADSAGHEGVFGTSVVVISFTVDNTAPATPTISYLNPATPTANDSSFTIGGTIADPSDVATFTLYLNGVAIANPTIDSTTGDWRYIYHGPLVEGNYNFSVSAVDAHGNSTDPIDVAAMRTVTVGPFIAPNGSTIPGNGARTSLRSAAATPASTTSPTGVLGAQTSKDDTAILGTQTDKDANNGPVVQASESGWKILGLAWYWWLLILAALAVLWWLIAGFLRRRGENAEA